MKELASKRKVRGILYSPITAVILVILIIFFAKGTWNLYQKSGDALAGREGVEKEMVDIKQRENFLKGELAALDTSSGLEERIREKFNVKRSGEEVAVIIKPDDSSSSSDATPIKQWFHDFIVRVVDFFQ